MKKTNSGRGTFCNIYHKKNNLRNITYNKVKKNKQYTKDNAMISGSLRIGNFQLSKHEMSIFIALNEFKSFADFTKFLYSIEFEKLLVSDQLCSKSQTPA